MSLKVLPITVRLWTAKKLTRLWTTKKTNRWIKFPFTLQSLYTTLWIPSFWPPERSIARTPRCGRQEAETQRAWRALIWQQSFMWPTYISCKGGKSVLIMKKTVWKNYLNFVKDVTMIYVHFTIIIIRVSKKKWGINFVPSLVTFSCTRTDLWWTACLIWPQWGNTMLTQVYYDIQRLQEVIKNND
jgi:hypothetical protein